VPYAEPATVLAEAEWRARAAAHAARVDALTAGHRERRGRREEHPVEDFLFTYYRLRPGRLRRWQPGAGVVVAGATAEDLGGAAYRAVEGGLRLDLAALPAPVRAAVRPVHTLLTRTAARPARLGCFGLHEWAMVYREEPGAVRHAAWPLRLAPAQVQAVVDERGLRCSHADAYRFFTPAARPLNALAPSRERQADLEQPGCLHANMDLYRWAYTLGPLVPAELLADCFVLARDLRVLDMRASPYDLAALGHPPVRVETADGRAEYAGAQRAFAERAAPLRARLAAACAPALRELSGVSARVTREHPTRLPCDRREPAQEES